MEVGDRSDWIDPFNDRHLLAYYERIYYWHGFIRFLGLPHLKDNPDVPIERLFVQPELTGGRVAPRVEGGDDDGRIDLLTAISANPRLVVLGDPGSGKSTLVSWISWLLSRSGKGPWPEALGPVVPLPMVVRELELGKKPTWDGLIEAFLARPVAEGLDRGLVDDLLARGQAFVLLDGVDEIARVSTREALRDAVLEGVEKHPGCRWLVTSRIVGYDRVPFHLDPLAVEHLETDEAVANAFRRGRLVGDTRSGAGAPWATVLQVSPFSDNQIERFCDRWYRRYEASEAEAEKKAADLRRSLHANHRTLALARTPNLLTLMALIHRIQARLPHGRALLYGKIVDAYLESIDAYRGLQEVDYSLEEKRRWLAWVGFRMQRRRSEAEGEERESREILVDESELVSWLREAMTESPRTQDTAEPERAARAFVDYIARRSGLLLPRGQERYAFTHLSFQEFFAALHLERRIKSPRWLGGTETRTDHGDGRDDLLDHADSDAWREPLVILFGLLAGDPDWATELANLLFGSGYSALFENDQPIHPQRAHLLAEIATDPHSGLPGDRRHEARELLWRWEIRRQEGTAPEDRWQDSPLVARSLLAADPVELPDVWTSLASAWAQRDRSIIALNLSGTSLTDVSPLAALESLQALDLSYTGVTDVSPLAAWEGLRSLHLSGTGVTDVSPLAALKRLQTLDLSNTSPTDISALAALENLQVLDLSNTSLTDISPLAVLENLEDLHLWGTGVTDVSPLEAPKNLRSLSLSGARIADVSPLAALENLETLYLMGMRVTDVSPLAALENLRTLYLIEMGAIDLSTLADLENLQTLALMDARVPDVSPLAVLKNLQKLYLSGTGVTDVSPLTALENLQTLHLANTDVTDISPLAAMKNLQILDLSNTDVTDISPLAALESLQKLHLWDTGVTNVSSLAAFENLTIYGALIDEPGLGAGSRPTADLATK